MTAKILLQSKKPSGADVLVVIVDEAPQKSAELKTLDKSLGGGLMAHLKSVDFHPEKGGVVQLPVLSGKPSSHLVLAGVRDTDGGDGARFSEVARLTEAVAVGVRSALGQRPSNVQLIAPKGSDLSALANGAKLGAYRFEKYRSKPGTALKSVAVLVDKTPSAAEKKAFARGLSVADGVCMARDLINEPPNVLTPAEFAKRARSVAKKNKLSCKILDHQGIIKAGMHLHDAVGKGSENSPYFIHLTYKPAKPKGKVVFVGKGLTFDSGGLCLKPALGMLGMKTDMSGGAAVLGLMEAVSALNPSVEVHGIIGAAENGVDAKSYRPSDVLSSLSGKGVEVINTDAEGRLVLADALTYASRLKPDFIVDAATLTGATLVSLGAPYSAFYTNSEAIAENMDAACADMGESFWRMPLIEELAGQLKSTVTDLKHTGDRMGGAITAALFLREFTDGVPWMHCDIPGPVYRDSASGLHPQGGTGHAVMTFLELVRRHSQKPIVSAAKSKPAAKKK